MRHNDLKNVTGRLLKDWCGWRCDNNDPCTDWEQDGMARRCLR